MSEKRYDLLFIAFLILLGAFNLSQPYGKNIKQTDVVYAFNIYRQYDSTGNIDFTNPQIEPNLIFSWNPNEYDYRIKDYGSFVVLEVYKEYDVFQWNFEVVSKLFLLDGVILTIVIFGNIGKEEK